MQQNMTPQMNVVIVEEKESKDDSTLSEATDTKVLHVECDCSGCIQIEDVPDVAADVLAITRSRKQFHEDSDMSDLSVKDPKVWEAQ